MEKSIGLKMVINLEKMPKKNLENFKTVNTPSI